MQYFIFPVLMLIYFELLGRYVLYKFKKETLNFSFIIGFIFTMASYYLLSWPITALNQSFNLLLIFSVAYFLITCILIIKNIKNISFKFNYKLYLVFIVIMAFEIMVSYNRTLGETHGFDTLYYLNMISFNIKNPAMNTLHPHFGTYPNTDVQWITYVFQSFYYFVPAVIYLFRVALSFVGMSFETLPAYVWGFQILAHAIFIGTTLTCVQEIKPKSKLLSASLIILLCLFLGNLYYNNVYGFIGNNYRMSIHAIATLYLFRYFKDHDRNNLCLVYMAMLGMCGVSSTGTFSFVFLLFGLFFVLYNQEQNLLRHYVIVLYIPTINILITKLGIHLWLFVAVAIIFGVIYLLNDFILKLYQNKYFRIGTIAFCSLIFIIGSFMLTHNIFDFNIFFNNYSEIADMSWDYFMFNDVRHYIFNALILIPLVYFLIKDYRHPFAIVSIILIIVFFNPMGCTIMNKFNWVYYRSYDIVVNQFTIIYFINYLALSISQDKLSKLFSILVFMASSILAYIQIPKYYHESFIVQEDFNPLFKIDNSELEVIYNVRQMIEDKQIQNPKIITSTFFMPSFIENSTYLFGKEKRYDYDKFNDTSYALYLIFFPFDGIYDNFYPQGQLADYQNTIKYLDECDYDILIVDNGNYYQNETGNYLPITTLVEADGHYQKSEYSTAKYAVYYLK